jgi:hypothetical protein
MRRSTGLERFLVFVLLLFNKFICAWEFSRIVHRPNLTRPDKKGEGSMIQGIATGLPKSAQTSPKYVERQMRLSLNMGLIVLLSDNDKQCNNRVRECWERAEAQPEAECFTVERTNRSTAGS